MEAASAATANGKEVKPASSTSTEVATMISESAKSVVLNVGGQKYEVLRKNLTNAPGSRLWKLVHANTTEDILRFCDRYKPGSDSEANFVPAEYYFDHNYTSFAEILDFYRTGHLHLQATNCAYTTREDIQYWGIDELLVEPCCAVKYYPEIEICIKEIDTEETEKQREIEREKLEDFGTTWYGKLRKKLWNLFEYPSTSRGAQFIACWSLSMVVISTARFVLSSALGDYWFEHDLYQGGAERYYYVQVWCICPYAECPNVSLILLFSCPSLVMIDMTRFSH